MSLSESDFIGKDYAGAPMDRFEGEASGWIWNESGEKTFYAGDLTVVTSPEVLERIQFNVIERYRSLVRFPDPCPNCGRNGLDHKDECPTPEWKGTDRSVCGA